MVGPFGLRPQGTMSRRALPLAKDLASRGHQIEVLLPPWACPEDSGQVWEEDGVSIHNIALPPSIPLLKEVIVSLRLLNRIRNRRPDVVHCFKPKAYSGLNAAVLWGLAKSHLSKVRVVLDTDDWEGRGGWNDLAAYSAIQKRFFAWQERWGMTHCHALTVASRTLETLAREMGIDDQIIHYVPNGVEPQSDAPDAALGDRVRREWQLGDSPVILLFTRFFEFEPRRLVEILDQVWAEVPSAHLLVVGRGLFGEEDRFLSAIQDAGLSSHVTYVGWRQQQELPGYFAASDLAICPFEDTLLNRTRCPAKVADLMAAGLPIVADDVGQVGEYIEHLVSGYLVPPGEVRTFAAGVIRLLRDELLRQELGGQARESVMRRFGWPRLAPTVERAYAG
jgi:glycosyltransferase involved in cell wall biosynthesis